MSRWLSSTLVGMVLAFGSALVFPLVRVPSSSMEPTFAPGRLVLLDAAGFWAHRRWPAFLAPSYGEIVVFRLPARRGLFIKRIVGLPGDRIRIMDGTLMRNGRGVAEPFVKYRSPPGYDWPYALGHTSITVPAGMVFVLGDNRQGSVDSRVFGAVPEANIVARAAMEIP